MDKLYGHRGGKELYESTWLWILLCIFVIYPEALVEENLNGNENFWFL